MNGLSVGAVESQGRVLQALFPLNIGAIKGLKCSFMGSIMVTCGRKVHTGGEKCAEWQRALALLKTMWEERV